MYAIRSYYAFLRFWLKQLKLEATGEPGLRNVDQKICHLRFPWQLPKHGTKRLFHLFHLLPICFEIRSLLLFGFEDLFQLRFFALHYLVLFPTILAVEVVPCPKDDDAHKGDRDPFCKWRPCTGVAEIEIIQISYNFV